MYEPCALCDTLLTLFPFISRLSIAFDPLANTHARLSNGVRPCRSLAIKLSAAEVAFVNSAVVAATGIFSKLAAAAVVSGIAELIVGGVMTPEQLKAVLSEPDAKKRDRMVKEFEAKAIGERLRQARREAGMTQEDLAEVSSFSKRSLQDYEAGVTIPYRNLTELATILRRSVAWFLHGAEADRSPEEDAALAERMTAVEAQLQELVQEIQRRRGAG